MNRSISNSTLVTIAITAVIVIAANVWQRQRTAAAREQLAELQRAAEAQPGKAGSKPGLVAAAETTELARSIVGLSRGAHTNEEQMRAVEKSRALVADLSKADHQQLAIDLMAGAAAQDAEPVAQMAVFLMAAERDPVWAIAFLDENQFPILDRLRPEVFAQLVKEQPDMAWQRLAPAIAEGRMTEERKSAIREYLKFDMDRARTLLRVNEAELRDSNVVEMITTAAVERATAERIWHAAQTESDTKIRRVLLDGVITAEQHQRGVAGLRSALSGWPVEERQQILNGLGDKIVGAETGKIIEWMLDDLPESEQQTAVSSAVRQWTKRDFNAVGTWLGEQQPSGMRDYAIQTFVANVSDLDPDAALAWAREISDDGLRAKALSQLGSAQSGPP
ncbi:MAG: hypothetical protein ACR2RV_18750 [Verrucomicrobiales bacterium]